MKKDRKKKKPSVKSLNRKNLRKGSSTVKKKLLELNPHCDICGGDKKLQLHHIYLIRHGFPTKLEHCCLLCVNCHPAFHKRWDKYLDVTFRENPNAEFVKIYNVIKKL